MPAGVFELIYSTIILHERDGKYPSMDALAAWLQINYKAVHQRIQLAESLGIVAPFKRKQGPRTAGIWFNLTPFGADLFKRCLDAEERIYFSYATFFSKNPEARPPYGQRYLKLKQPDYRQLLRDIELDGLAFQPRGNREATA